MLLESQSATEPSERAPVPQSELDYALTAQILVAWAGERGEDQASLRLNWWHSLLAFQDGGQYLFGRLTPLTASWAVLQALREVARRADAQLRAKDSDPDRILSLYSLGFEIDERLDERLHELKRSRRAPEEVLPGLAEFMGGAWNRNAFSAWAGSFGPVEFVAVPSGRRIKATQPTSLEETVGLLLAALIPFSDDYPMPHFRVAA